MTALLIQRLGLPLLLAALCSLFVGTHVHKMDTLEADHTISQIRAKADAEVLAATTKARGLEQQLGVINQQIEVTNAHASQVVQDNALLNRQLVARAGGLRDPGARPALACRVPGAAAPASGPDPAAPGAQLSNEASDFLLALAREADEAAVYADTCHEWAVKVTKAWNERYGAH